MNENDILGFDPRQLTAFAENTKNPQKNSNIYHPKPEEATSSDGVYRATLKLVYNPFNFNQSIIEQQGYYIEDEQGGLYVVSSLTNGDNNCPIFKAWKKCRYADEGSDLWKQQAKKEQGGQALFDKRFARYVTVQIIEDTNHPELEGKYMFWKIPVVIYNLVKSKQNPSTESNKCPIPVMDFLFGRSIEIEVAPGPGPKGSIEYKRQTSYTGELSEDVVSALRPDKTPLLTAQQQVVLNKYVEQMKEIWKEKDSEKRNTLQAAVNADPNTAELRSIYGKVLEEIKTFCPNVYDEFTFKPWDEATTKRVENWINIVLSGQLPKVNSNAPAPTAGAMNDITTAPNPFDPSNMTPTPVDTMASPGGMDDDELPF